MKIMLIEDDANKRKVIISYLKKQGINECSIILAETFTDFASKLADEDIGLFIIDLMIPYQDKGRPEQIGRSILETIVKTDKKDALMLSISSYPKDFKDLKEFYESHGCILANFKEETWKSTLNHLLVQLKSNIRFDFVIFCALEEERKPYVSLLEGKIVQRGAIDCLDVEINKKRGTIILLPRMGVVNAAIMAGLCIDRFKPKLVGMSGICGGFSNSVNLGQLVICELAYEYQSGKWSEDGFKQEVYQVETDQNLLIKLKHLINQDELLKKLDGDFIHGNKPQKVHPPKLGIFTSGSAVIANEEYLENIKLTHRKVGALDMEVFSIQRAAQIAYNRPLSICAKVVVDLCNVRKNDDLHDYGCYVSAKFLIESIQTLDIW